MSDKFDGYSEGTQKYNESDLQDQDQRQTVAEKGLARLVMEEEHAQNGADASADDGKQ